MGFFLDARGLHHDIGTALALAPTAQLRHELAAYERSTGENGSNLQVTTALSQFDSQVRTQLQGCGFRPIGR
jgi:hypothetical protein